MNRKSVFIAVGSLAFAANGFAATTANRCSVDSLNSAEALGRNQYVKTCFPDVILKHGSLLAGRSISATEEAWGWIRKTWEVMSIGGVEEERPWPMHYTPAYADSVAQLVYWPAPKVAPVAANLANPAAVKSYCQEPQNVPPEGIIFTHLLACRSSCFAPDVRVFFDKSYIDMKTAFEKRPTKIAVAKQSSTFEDMGFELREIAEWTISIRDEPHTLRTLKTASGKTLDVTLNHPLITSDGYFRDAGKIVVGDSLVQANGEADLVVSADNHDHFGKVYNVAPDDQTAKGNVIVAEGLLSGTAYIQTDGQKLVEERVFRSQLPTEILL